MAYEHTLSQF